MLTSIQVNNLRVLTMPEPLRLGRTVVLFGPNGSGKSTVFEALWLLHDALAINLQHALQSRGNGFGLANWNAPTSPIGIQVCGGTVGLHDVKYTILFSHTPAGILYNPAEHIVSPAYPTAEYPDRPQWRSERMSGEAHGLLYGPNRTTPSQFDIDPSRLMFDLLTAQPAAPRPSINLRDTLMQSVQFHSRFLPMMKVRAYGSQSTQATLLSEDADNLWSVLRQLNDLRDVDPTGPEVKSRHETIVRFMTRAFNNFKAFGFRQGGQIVFAEFLLHGLNNPIITSHVPDGMIQMTANLVALFGRSVGEQLVMLDEPDLSLHPWAIHVLHEAIEHATTHWGRQVLLATHSPTLISLFKDEELYLIDNKDGQTLFKHPSEATEHQELLKEYGAGALYVNQLIGEQSDEPLATVETIGE